MRLILSVVVSLFGAVPALSEIIVKSGEHETFSRLVVYMPRGVDWTTAVDGTTFRLDVEGYQDGFDIEGIFDILPRNRLDSVDAKADQLIVDLGCECRFRQYTLPTGFLVIDVVDGVPDSVFQEASAPAVAPFMAPALPTVIPRSNEPVLPLVIAKPPIEQTLPEPEEMTDRHERIDEFRRSLLEQFGRAGAQNLLTVPQVEIAPPVTAEVVDEGPEEFARVSPAPQTRLEITTAQDDAMPQIRELLESSTQACYEPDFFDISNWRGEQPFMEEQGAIRSQLYGEFDKISDTQALRLVRLYLHYGLASEAHMTLNSLQVESDAALAARQIAHILDGRGLSPDAPLSAMRDCSGEVALWAVLGGGEGAISSEATERIVAEYSRLPAELRRFIGTRLSNKLEASGEPVAAQVVRNALDRSVPYEQKDTTTVAPSVDVMTANDTELRAMLERSDESSPMALAHLLEGILARGEPVSETDIDLAASYAHQLRGSPLSETLKTLELRSISRLGGFRTAFDRALEELASEARAKVINAAVTDMLTLGSPGDRSLMAAAMIREGVAADLEDETAQRLSDDLLALGLPDLALEISQMRNVLPSAAQRQAALLQDRAYAEALEAMAAEGSDAALRANLHLLEETPNELWRDGAAGIEDEALKQRIAWRAAAWEDVTGDDATSTLARQIATAPVILEASEPLTQSEQLLDKSEAARDAIFQLLNRENQP